MQNPVLQTPVRECGTTSVLQLRLLICDERTVLCQPLCRLCFCTGNRDRRVSGWAKNNYVKVNGKIKDILLQEKPQDEEIPCLILKSRQSQNTRSTSLFHK